MFTRNTLSPIETGGTTSIWAYHTDDTSISTLAPGYFNDAADIFQHGSGIIVISKYGTFFTYVANISDDGVVSMQVGTTPVLQGTILSQNEITRTEIEAILTTYGIFLPLDQSMQITFHDPDAFPDKAFFCTYDVNDDQWFFEKLDPCPA